MVQLVAKDSKLASSTIRGLIRQWPIADSVREVLFLSEMEEMLAVIPGEKFEEFSEDFFTRIGECVGSLHFQVAEKALQMWGNGIFIEFIKENLPLAMTILLPYLFR